VTLLVVTPHDVTIVCGRTLEQLVTVHEYIEFFRVNEPERPRTNSVTTATLPYKA
jgi:hypothetical protein